MPSRLSPSTSSKEQRVMSRDIICGGVTNQPHIHILHVYRYTYLQCMCKLSRGAWLITHKKICISTQAPPLSPIASYRHYHDGVSTLGVERRVPVAVAVPLPSLLHRPAQQRHQSQAAGGVVLPGAGLPSRQQVLRPGRERGAVQHAILQRRDKPYPE